MTLTQMKSLQALYEHCFQEQLKLQKEQRQLLEERKRLQADLQLCLEEMQQLQVQSPGRRSLSLEASQESQKIPSGSDSYQRSYESDTASEENFLKSYNSTTDSASEAGDKASPTMAYQHSYDSIHSSENSNKSCVNSTTEVEGPEAEEREVTAPAERRGHPVLEGYPSFPPLRRLGAPPGRSLGQCPGGPWGPRGAPPGRAEASHCQVEDPRVTLGVPPSFPPALRSNLRRWWPRC